MDELPFQTYERIIGRQWPGGRSETIKMCLAVFGITYEPGTAEANLKLQKCLLTLKPALPPAETQ